MFVNVGNISIILADVYIVDMKYFFDMVHNVLVSCGINCKNGVRNYDKKATNLTFGICICLQYMFYSVKSLFM